MTTVVNVKKQYLVKRGYKNFEDWATDPNHVYIGRNMSFYVPGAVGSKWGNPFHVKQYGPNCLELYKQHVITSNLLEDLKELKGKELGCWCKTDKDKIECHGDVLIQLIDEYC